MPHREGIRNAMAKTDLTGLIVHDWGCGTKPITQHLSGTPVSYTGLDKRDDVGADVVVDFSRTAVDLPIKADAAFCIEVLEHCPFPHSVMANIYSNLKPGGVLILTVPFLYPIHSDEDYWRFTDFGLKFLLEQAGFKIDAIRSTGFEGEELLAPDDQIPGSDKWIRADGWFVKAHRL